MKVFCRPVKVWEARFKSATFEERAASAIEAAGRVIEDVAVSVPTTKFPSEVEAKYEFTA